jgi:hypothetical protein
MWVRRGACYDFMITLKRTKAAPPRKTGASVAHATIMDPFGVEWKGGMEKE